ncbi:MAG: MFS transporter [Chryseobacterium sp.]|nr:MAG: MFS transporter [Chryseobacterium sp.]
MNASPLFKTIVIYALAFLTGINFVIFPALGTVFTDPAVFGLSQSQFGNLFIPQVIFIGVAALATPFLVNHFGPKTILIIGSALMISSGSILWSLQFLPMQNGNLFTILLILVAATALGFGLSVTTLNPVAARLFPERQSSAILMLQFLVGVGTASSPLLMRLAGNTANWMYVPAMVVPLMLVAFILLLMLNLKDQQFFKLPSTRKLPSRLWIFVAAVVIYGFLEGTFGGFGAVILQDMGLDSNNANLGLSLFWGGVAVSRLFVGLVSRFVGLSKYFLISPVLVGICLFFLPNLQHASAILLLMSLIGFLMGSIFPGSIGWATVEFPAYAVLVSGVLMAADQTGTGIITQLLGYNPEALTSILRYLSFSTIIITVLFFFLSRNSKIKEAF